MEILFNFRPEGKEITTEKGVFNLMVLRKGPRGLVGVVRGMGPVVIYNNDVATEHMSDTEEELTNKLIEVLNAN